MNEPIRIVGSYLSPYVRKVLVALHLKGLDYEIDSLVPFYGDERFSEISPIRRIPVLVDDCVTLCDSTVICEYLEERHPGPPLLPAALEDRARARWLEEFADTRMGEVFIWRLFNQLAIGPSVWRRKPDDRIVERSRNEEIPEILDYLEGQLPAEGTLFASVSIADVAIASFFRNAEFVGYRPDPERWPRVARFVDAMFAHDAFARLRPIEERLLRVHPAKQWEALRDTDAPGTAESYGTRDPRPGVMKTD